MTTANNDNHAPILSNQALAAYFLNRTDNVQFEETAEAFILRIPKRSFAQQLTDRDGEASLSGRALKILSFAGSWGSNDNDGLAEYFSPQAVEKRRQASTRDRHL